MKVTRFEDLIAWQKAQDLAVILYQKFGTHNDFGFKNQLLRAVVSISNNIAEGFDRKTNKEFRYFLFVSMGSNSEVKSMMNLAERLKYIDQQEKIQFITCSEEIGKILFGLIRSIQTKK